MDRDLGKTTQLQLLKLGKHKATKNRLLKRILNYRLPFVNYYPYCTKMESYMCLCVLVATEKSGFINDQCLRTTPVG